MKLPATPRIVCLSDPQFSAKIYNYAFGSVPHTLERMGMPVLHLNPDSATPESFRKELEKFKPDLIFGFIQDHQTQKNAARLLDDYHPVPATNWSLEDPNWVVAKHDSQTMLDISASFDMWFCNDAKMVPYWRTKAEFMPPGFDDEVFFNAGCERKFHISYIGHLAYRPTLHMYWPYMQEMAKYRDKALMCLDRPTGLPILPPKLESLLRSRRYRSFLQRLPFWKAAWRNPRDKAEKAAFINQSKIHVGLNRVRGDWEEALLRLIPDYPLDRHGLFYQLKGRLFHAVGTGTLALNEHCPELEAMFDINKEIVTFEFGDVDGFRDKLAWYIDHDSERNRIAQAGYERARKDHTWVARIRQMMGVIQREL